MSLACPFANPGDAAAVDLLPETRLRLAEPKRMVVQYLTNDEGARELHLFYADQDISFDEPDLFTFGETLARQSLFTAGAAATWGENLDWPRVRELLTILLDSEILERAENETAPSSIETDRSRPSPLPPAPATALLHWDDCEAITRELTGIAVEPGHLELILPVFRVAHAAMDADGRQVGEANVFPRALRVEVPTDWIACTYPGTRFGVDRPMNHSALKGMRAHWPQMMAALRAIRRRYLERFPDLGTGWTLGRLERLATLVLAVPTWEVMRHPADFRLHPALSSLFRVTDGLRMTLHQMMFVPVGEPALSPDTQLTAEEIHAYAERNYSFHSETGVCAGPRNMVQTFLETLIHGAGDDGDLVFDADMQIALAGIDAAFNYGLLGLQAHAAVFSVWPAIGRCYEDLAEALASAVTAGASGLAAFSQRIDDEVAVLRRSTYLGREDWRSEREAAYADMFDACRLDPASASLEALLDSGRDRDRLSLRVDLTVSLAELPAARGAPENALISIADGLLTLFQRMRACLRVATSCQAAINTHLGRAQPVRPFTSAEINVHTLLQGRDPDRLSFLIDTIAEGLGLHFIIDRDRIDWAQRPQRAPIARVSTATTAADNNADAA